MCGTNTIQLSIIQMRDKIADLIFYLQMLDVVQASYLKHLQEYVLMWLLLMLVQRILKHLKFMQILVQAWWIIWNIFAPHVEVVGDEYDAIVNQWSDWTCWQSWNFWKKMFSSSEGGWIIFLNNQQQIYIFVIIVISYSYEHKSLW